LKKIGDKFISDLAPGEELEFSVKEGAWFNASIEAEDIDGDPMTFLTNLTDNIGDDDLENFKLSGNEMSFLPTNSDVGEIYVNLTMSDGNGSGEVYYRFKIVVQNSNNPPEVEITVPVQGQKFKETDEINFKCIVNDLDFLVKGYPEQLSFVWYSNLSGEPLASAEQGVNLTDISVKLKPGRQTISVIVTDRQGDEGLAEVKIIVTPVKDEDQDFFTQYWWLLLLILIIIIIILIIAAVVIRKRRDEKFKSLLGDEDRLPRLQPEMGTGILGQVSAGPYTEPQMALPVGAVRPYTAARTAAVPQLPPRSDGVSNDEMVQLLELRLAKGEIDLETYKKLSEKYEGAARYGVTPQQQKLLPPATQVAQPQPISEPSPQVTTPTQSPSPAVQNQSSTPRPVTTPSPTPTSAPASAPIPTVQQPQPQVIQVSSTPTLTPNLKKADEENK
jgi:hypothetical protein